MKVNGPTKVRGALRAALRDMKQAERLACVAMEKEYPIGARIRYAHGLNWRHGTVAMHSGWTLRIRVRHERSGCSVWIGAERLEHDD
jgi:hypothetical protein